ncbi:hypothetical protein DFJ73DRAFT_765314 [Zopfochytrium polystomum]|nr:hypothetical protein DFJ73DRAFT_765314 [Zopfochytrium polystomum]
MTSRSGTGSDITSLPPLDPPLLTTVSSTHDTLPSTPGCTKPGKRGQYHVQCCRGRPTSPTGVGMICSAAIDSIVGEFVPGNTSYTTDFQMIRGTDQRQDSTSGMASDGLETCTEPNILIPEWGEKINWLWRVGNWCGKRIGYSDAAVLDALLASKRLSLPPPVYRTRTTEEAVRERLLLLGVFPAVQPPPPPQAPASCPSHCPSCAVGVGSECGGPVD